MFFLFFFLLLSGFYVFFFSHSCFSHLLTPLAVSLSPTAGLPCSVLTLVLKTVTLAFVCWPWCHNHVGPYGGWWMIHTSRQVGSTWFLMGTHIENQTWHAREWSRVEWQSNWSARMRVSWITELVLCSLKTLISPIMMTRITWTSVLLGFVIILQCSDPIDSGISWNQDQDQEPMLDPYHDRPLQHLTFHHDIIHPSTML